MATAERSQNFVPVSAVRNGIVTLKDGSYRGILMCSSVNFALKSADEQQAIVGGFQNFLNTLDFSIEIAVHSRKMDIRPYLGLLAQLEDAQKTDLMKIQLREYMAFVQNFTEGTNIMTKTFYLIIPYTRVVTVAKAASIIPGFGRGAAPADSAFEEDRVQIEQRMSLAAAGLQACGVRAVPLGTEEIIELLYRSFNPGSIDQPIRLEQ
jgi:type IV secretory pathway VirB4 component